MARFEVKNKDENTYVTMRLDYVLIMQISFWVQMLTQLGSCLAFFLVGVSKEKNSM